MTIQQATARYRYLHSIILQSVFDVTFPFGVVAPVRREMDQITQRFGIERCSDCNAIGPVNGHACKVTK